MDFLELTKKRFSARNYKSDKVEQDKIDYIIECARLAPSAVNYQPWHFMVVKRRYSNVIIENGLQKHQSISWYVLINRKPGYVSLIIKIMQTSTPPLQQNIFVLLLQKWG